MNNSTNEFFYLSSFLSFFLAVLVSFFSPILSLPVSFLSSLLDSKLTLVSRSFIVSVSKWNYLTQSHLLLRGELSKPHHYCTASILAWILVRCTRQLLQQLKTTLYSIEGSGKHAQEYSGEILQSVSKVAPQYMCDLSVSYDCRQPQLLTSAVKLSSD